MRTQLFETNFGFVKVEEFYTSIGTCDVYLGDIWVGIIDCSVSNDPKHIIEEKLRELFGSI